MVKPKITLQNLIFKKKLLKKIFKGLLLSCLVINFTTAGLLEYLGCRRPSAKSKPRDLVVTPSGYPDAGLVSVPVRPRPCCTTACHNRVKPLVVVTGATIGSLMITEEMMQRWAGKSYLWHPDNSVNQSSMLFTAGMTLIGYLQARAYLTQHATRALKK